MRTNTLGARIGRDFTKGALEELKNEIFSPSGLIFIVGFVIIIHVFKSRR